MAKRKPTRSGAAASPTRGEHTLTLAGTPYRLRPSFAALQAIDELVGPSTIEIARRCNACTLALADVGIIAAELMRAGADPNDEFARNISAERVAELIHEDGYAHAYAVIAFALGDAITGGRTVAGEAKAVTTT